MNYSPTKHGGRPRDVVNCVPDLSDNLEYSGLSVSFQLEAKYVLSFTEPAIPLTF